MLRFLLIAVPVLLAANPAFAARQKAKQKADQIALARLLLLDGHPRRALAALSEVDLSNEAIDLAELDRLRGLAEHELGLFAEAAASLQRAMQHGEDRPATWYALANAQLSAADAQSALATLEVAPPAIWAIIGAHETAARAYAKLGDLHRAFEAADDGLALFSTRERGSSAGVGAPNTRALAQLRLEYLLELRLMQEARRAAGALLAHPGAAVDDDLKIAGAFVNAGDLEGAIAILETTLLRHPDAREVREQLARAYFEAGRPLSAAELLRPLAIEDPAIALLAAELYARAGKFDRALELNRLAGDQKKKVRQRLTLLIQAERYHEAAALDARLSRLGLLAEEKLLYALAYAHYVSGNHARVEALLSRVTQPELFAKATELRRRIEQCAADVWKCD